MINGGRGVWPVLAASAASAVLFFFGTGFDPVALLTWLAPIPVLWLAPRVSTKVALAAAFAAYLLGTANTWWFYPGSHDIPLPVGAAICVGMALTFTVTVWIFRALLVRGRPLFAATVSAATWTGLLYVVSISNPKGIGNTLGNYQGDVPVVQQVAALTGMWGVDFLVHFVPSAVAALLAPGVAKALRVRTAIVGAVVLTVALGGGALRLATDDPGPATKVALVVNDSGGWGTKIATPAGQDLLHGYLAQLAALPAGTKVAVLAEGAFEVTDANLPALVEPMAELARARGTDIVVGYNRISGGKKYNTALTIPANGGAPVPYLKHHDSVSVLGKDLAFPPSLGGQTGVMICFDVNFPNPARDYAAAGARTVLFPAADETANGWLHSRMAVLRAAENGMAMAWAGRTGTLTLIDGYGRVLADAPSPGKDRPFATVVGDLPPGPGATPYTRLGDWFAWLCLATMAAGVGLLVADRRRRTAPVR